MSSKLALGEEKRDEAQRAVGCSGRVSGESSRVTQTLCERPVWAGASHALGVRCQSQTRAGLVPAGLGFGSEQENAWALPTPLPAILQEKSVPSRPIFPSLQNHSFICQPAAPKASTPKSMNYTPGSPCSRDFILAPQIK